MGDRLKLRPLYIAAAAAILAGLGAAVLYGMFGEVHAVARPPAAISRLKPAEKPQPLPQVAFTDAKGGRHILSEFRGHYVLLNLWATWCGPCVQELPALAQLKAAIPDLQIVAVNVGRSTPEETRAFLAEHKAGALAVYNDRDIALVRAFKAYGLPLSVLIDGQGREIARAEGPGDWDAPESVAWFKSLLAHRHA
jgi:thiol-disulfide isomerase/thioredoxin